MQKEELQQKVKDLVTDIVKAIGYTVEVVVEVEEDDAGSYIKVLMEDESLSELIGYHGKHLNGLQHLVNIAVNRDLEEKVKVVIDVNGYRKKREEYLKSVAERAVYNVRESGLPITLQPMKAADRRIIHVTLKDEEGVTTTSEGEEPDRYVVISPV